MKLVQAGRRSAVRVSARAAAARYAPIRGYDERAAFLALGITLLATLALVCGTIALRG